MTKTTSAATSISTPAGAAAKIVCCECRKPGRKGNPLLHGRRGYAHNGCDRP